MPLIRRKLARESIDYTTKLRYEAYKRGLELYVRRYTQGGRSFLIHNLPCVQQKSGDLGHCILNDLFEEFGDDEAGDARDATSMLYISENIPGHGIVLFLIIPIPKKDAIDTVRTQPLLCGLAFSTQ